MDIINQEDTLRSSTSKLTNRCAAAICGSCARSHQQEKPAGHHRSGWMRREVGCPEKRGLSARGLKASATQLGCRRSIRSAPEGLAALMDPSSNGKQEARASRLFYGSGKYVYTLLPVGSSMCACVHDSPTLKL